MADFELPGYELYERVGRGGMASVYRALHLNLDREIAIKVMDPAMSSDESFSERFIREARISARLVHPHILQIYDVNTFDGMNFIAMEYLSGGDVGDFIHKAMPQRLIYQVMEQMLDALDYASRHGYVHRDIKPSNIMVRAEGDFVLTDFGIARAANSGTQMTQTGLMVGTPSYMSPEQAKGMEVDGRSDIYAMAILCFEMLTKKLPYESESAVSTAVMHLTEDIPTLEGRLAPYQEFFNKAMAKKADDRFQTGREMYQAFMAASSGFDDAEVLTEALPIEPEKSETEPKRETDMNSTSLISDVTQVGPGTSSSGSRPYKLQGTEQRERLVSGIHKREKKSSAVGAAMRAIVVLAVLGGGGYFGYDYWQKQQQLASDNMRSIATEIAAAYTAIDNEDLPAAARSFNKVLKIDAANAAASDGLKKVGQLYGEAIGQSLQQRDSDAVGRLLDEYAAVVPNNADLSRYRSDYAQLKEDLQQEAQREAENLAAQQEQEQALAEQSALIEERLMQAAQALEQTPQDPAMAEQAAGFYQEVLEMDPENEAALAGVASLGDYFVEQANEAAAAGDFILAADVLAAAEQAIPGQAAISNMQQELPAMEARFDEQQDAAKRKAEEAARASELAAAAEQQALEAADQGLQSLQMGDTEAAQQIYDEVSASHPQLDATRQLQNELNATYARLAQEQIESKDYDSALKYVSLGKGVAPQDPAWAQLQSQIESSQSGRRRLGAY